MKTISRDQIVATLSQKILEDEDFLQVAAFIKTCPTCHDKKVYHLDNQEFPCDCVVQKLLSKHYLAAGIPKEYHDICIHDFFGEARDKLVPKIENYIEEFESYRDYGLGFSFSGPIGVGKTFALTTILKELLKRGIGVYFTTLQDVIDTLGASWKEPEAKRKLESRLKTAPVLAIDEIRTDPRNAGGFLANGLDVVVRYRVSNLLPTLISTNHTAEELEHNFERVFSLLSARNTWVELDSYDVRRNEIYREVSLLRKRGEKRPVC